MQLFSKFLQLFTKFSQFLKDFPNLISISQFLFQKHQFICLFINLMDILGQFYSPPDCLFNVNYFQTVMSMAISMSISSHTIFNANINDNYFRQLLINGNFNVNFWTSLWQCQFFKDSIVKKTKQYQCLPKVYVNSTCFNFGGSTGWIFFNFFIEKMQIFGKKYVEKSLSRGKIRKFGGGGVIFGSTFGKKLEVETEANFPNKIRKYYI